MADTREKAVATAYEYQQGNIAGLDDTSTRRLIASVVSSESRGGDLAITNHAGFVGRYQAGATMLADSGYVDHDKLKAAMGDHRSEWSWAKSGGMTKFLEDPSNWNHGLSLDKYKQSADLQDKAFKTHADNAYERGTQQGVLNQNEKPERIAGFLKAEHMAGFNAAAEAINGGRMIRDANGNSNYGYMHDITRDGDGLNKYMAHAKTQIYGSEVKIEDLSSGPSGESGPMKIGAVVRNDELPSISYTSNNDHKLYKEALIGINTLPANTFKNDEERQMAAATLALEAQKKGLNQIDQVKISSNGENLIAIQGKDDPNPANLRTHIKMSDVQSRSSEEIASQFQVLNESVKMAQKEPPKEQPKDPAKELQQDEQKTVPHIAPKSLFS
jgi:hypothetical protein